MEINRTGEINLNNQGVMMMIVKYHNARNIDIKFEDGTILKGRRYDTFKNGSIKNPFHPDVFGIGYIGNATCVNNKKIKNSYITWKLMIERCYSFNFQKKEPTYKDCKVCNEWHCFENFEKWYNENYYEIKGERMELDKDIIKKGNKIYSPETCIFVPQKINKLFTKRQNDRGDCPIGVKEYNFCQGYKNARYLVRWYDSFGKRRNKSGFDTIEEAFVYYKYQKEKVIKEIAEKYKSIIPCKLYTAMINYNVDITD